MAQAHINAVFSDIGGVLGTNGWDSGVRARVCEHFNLEHGKIDIRHRLMFDSYERGYMSFEAYLRNVFFAEPRPFQLEEVRQFAYAQSVPWPENLEFLRDLRLRNGVKVGLISNEGQGVAEYRVAKFDLRTVADFMVISHFTHLRKPDPEIWKLALNLAGADVVTSVYIDDRPVFAEVAADLGFAAIHHVSLAETRRALFALGLNVNGTS